MPASKNPSKFIFKIAGWGLLLFGLSGAFIEDSSFAETEDCFYIGLFLLFISAAFKTPLTQQHQLSENQKDAVVTGDKIWEPIASESASFKTQKMVEKRQGIIEVRGTASAALFNLLFAVMGLFALIVAILVFMLMDKPMGYAAIIPAIVGTVFLWFSLSEMRPKKRAVFNLSKRQFFKEGENSQDIMPLISHHAISFNDIHGLQLLEVYHPDSNFHHRRTRHSYYSYELNLILKSGERINIMSHGDKGDIILDAKRLAKHLAVPIWHKLDT